LDHLKRVADEFARQPQNFDHWAAKADDPGRFGAALGDARRGKLLDVACGPGVVTATLAPEASSVVAFDATEAMLEKAKARCAKAGLNNVAFRSGDAENLPFRDAEFDGVVTRLAIHHFANPQRALHQMFRVLRPGGAAVIVDAVSSAPAFATSNTRPGTWTASSKNGSPSSTILPGSSRSAPSSARSLNRAARPASVCRSIMAGSCFFTAGA
jgi:SAM-dependent methyltransferase